MRVFSHLVKAATSAAIHHTSSSPLVCFIRRYLAHQRGQHASQFVLSTAGRKQRAVPAGAVPSQCGGDRVPPCQRTGHWWPPVPPPPVQVVKRIVPTPPPPPPRVSATQAPDVAVPGVGASALQSVRDTGTVVGGAAPCAAAAATVAAAAAARAPVHADGREVMCKRRLPTHQQQSEGMSPKVTQQSQVQEPVSSACQGTPQLGLSVVGAVPEVRLSWLLLPTAAKAVRSCLDSTAVSLGRSQAFILYHSASQEA